MADKRFNRFRKFNFKIFGNLPQQSKKGISNFYGFVLNASKKYNLMRYYKSKKDKQ